MLSVLRWAGLALGIAFVTAGQCAADELPAPRAGGFRGAARTQTKRYFVVSNKTGTDLVLYVRVNGEVWNWKFSPGQQSRLCIDDEPILAERICFWGELPEWGLVYNNYKEVPVSFGPPYSAKLAVAEFIFTFNRPDNAPPKKVRRPKRWD